MLYINDIVQCYFTGTKCQPYNFTIRANFECYELSDHMDSRKQFVQSQNINNGVYGAQWYELYAIHWIISNFLRIMDSNAKNTFHEHGVTNIIARKIDCICCFCVIWLLTHGPTWTVT